MDCKDQPVQACDWEKCALVYNSGPFDVIPGIQLAQKVR